LDAARACCDALFGLLGNWERLGEHSVYMEGGDMSILAFH